MTVGLRLKEERSRLRRSQTDFAGLAGVKKGTQISWEKDASSPNAQALVAFAEAGADVLYILTGRRTNDLPGDAAAEATSQIEAQLAGIRRDIIEPGKRALPGEDAERTEKRVLEGHANGLAAILRYDRPFLTAELREEVEQLQAVVTNPSALALYRAADFAQMRNRRREMKARLAEWFSGGDHMPGEAVASLLVTLAMDYAVPVKLLVELVDEMHSEMTAKADKWGGMEPQR